MKALFNFLKTTFLGGFFFLLPLIVIVVLLQEGFKRLAKLVRPLGEWIAVKSVIGIQTPYLLAFILLLLVGFLAGLVAKTRVGVSFRDGIDHWLSAHIPGYITTKKQTKKLVGPPSAAPQRVCGLVNVGDTWSFALLMDEPKPGWRTVFLPNAPGTGAGSVYLVPEAAVKPLDTTYQAVTHCLENLGSGSTDVVKGKF